MKYELDQPIEVNSFQYKVAMTLLSGIVAGQQIGEKNYIKIMCMTDYANIILNKILIP